MARTRSCAAKIGAPRPWGQRCPGRPHSSIGRLRGIGFIAVCTALLALCVHAWLKRDELELAQHERHDAVSGIGVWLLLTGAGVLSILAVPLLPPNLVGLAGGAYALLAVIMPVYGLVRGRSRRRLGASGGQAL